MSLLRIFNSFHYMAVPLKPKIENVVLDYIIPDDSNENRPNNEQFDVDTIENSVNSSFFTDSDF